MTEKELLELRDLAEQGKVQFKERALDKNDISAEMSAFANKKGGKLIIGIKDKTGEINPLSYKEVQETTNLLTSVASDCLNPGIVIDINNVKVQGGVVVIAEIPKGHNKPYQDSKGVVWIKNGSDKRRVLDKNMLMVMMEECGTLKGDEVAVPDATLDDLDENALTSYLEARFNGVLKSAGYDASKHDLNQMVSMIIHGKTVEDLLRNLRFIRPDGQMTVAALLLLGKAPQRFLPVMTAKCISFVGNSVGGTQFRDKLDDFEMEGNLKHQFETIMRFFKRNLKSVQVKPDFNTLGELEVSPDALGELVANCLVHRSMCYGAPIRIFIFDDRIEIHSPGTLPGELSVDDVRNGVSMPRNSFLFQNAILMLPYTGAGSGITRVLEKCPDAKFENDESKYEFIVTIPRNSNQENGKTIQEPTDISKVIIQEDGKLSKKTIQEKLTKKQIDIVNFCTVPRSAQEIMDRLGLSNQNYNRRHNIGVLLELGVLEMTDPDHPKSRNQKYRKKQ